ATLAAIGSSDEVAMKVTLLGHASVLVELDGATCLMDPVFNDPFEEGAVVSCPRRTVRPEKLPSIDLLIVTHRHPDHFDIRSLARVPREADAICAADPLIVYVLKELGFTHVHPVHPMAPILSETFELYPTRSEVKTVKEFGVVFRDRSGTFWNQVDTSLSEETIGTVHDRFGRIDLLFAMYASQNFDFFESRATTFPFATHRDNLHNVLRIGPRVVVPGSAGFRFCGDHAGLNAFLFPISRGRFVTDLERLDPDLKTLIVNPGDVVEVAGGDVRHRPGASEAAVMEADDTDLIRFDPTAPIPELADPNPEGEPADRLAAVTDRFVVDGMLGYVQRGYADEDRVIGLYRRYGASYALGVVFPGGRVAWYCIDFGHDAPGLSREEAAPNTDAIHKIAASALVGWIEHRKSFFYVRAYSRRFTTLYHLAREGGAVRVEPEPLPDLLMHYLLNVAEGSERAAKDLVDRQIDEALGRGASRDVAVAPANSGGG
ncbi:MAG: MBL fold metallo-hydrolase, partial [Alphaproteobacteria bacterium]